jgi:hypothetical protein
MRSPNPLKKGAKRNYEYQVFRKMVLRTVQINHGMLLRKYFVLGFAPFLI